MPRETATLLHPREAPRGLGREDASPRAADVLAFVRQHGRTLSKDVQAHFDHGRIKRWAGNLNVSAHFLEGLHHRGLLRVARRESGTRVYQAIEHPPQHRRRRRRRRRRPATRAGQLLDVVVHLYAPLPAASLRYLGALLRAGAPHLAAAVREIQAQATLRYAHTQLDGVTVVLAPDREAQDCPEWNRRPTALPLPFDPVVWDRLRFHFFVLGLGIQVRSVPPSPQTPHGPLRHANALGRTHARLGEPQLASGKLHHALGFAALGPVTAPFGSRSTKRSTTCRFSAGRPKV